MSAFLVRQTMMFNPMAHRAQADAAWFAIQSAFAKQFPTHQHAPSLALLRSALHKVLLDFEQYYNSDECSRLRFTGGDAALVTHLRRLLSDRDKY